MTSKEQTWEVMKRPIFEEYGCRTCKYCDYGREFHCHHPENEKVNNGGGFSCEGSALTPSNKWEWDGKSK